jgi:hypothetical protein
MVVVQDTAGYSEIPSMTVGWLDVANTTMESEIVKSI